MLQLTTQQLDYLVSVVDSPTWAAAAADLGVSPSALSQGLAELERRVGVPLFVREGRRRTIHPDAGPMVDFARRVRAETRALTDWAAERADGRRGSLRVGMIDAAAVGHFASVLRELRTERPELGLHLTVAPSGPLLDQLRRSDIDVAVIVEPADPLPDLQIETLLEEALALYAPESGESEPRWGPFVSFPASSHTRALITAALAQESARFDVVAESHQPEVLREMVRLGMGWTVLPVIQAETEPFPLVRARRQPLLTRRVVVARRVGAIDDPGVTHLVDRLRAAAVAEGPPP